MYILPKPIFKGTIHGTVTERKVKYSYRQMGALISFYIRLDEKIFGVPDELTVLISGGGWKSYCTDIQEGDKLRLNGKIRKYPIKFWNSEIYLFEAKHIFNETSNHGF
ncbi:MAG: hypothetical protein HWN67_17750 [Candidatus Helarchaeota archaeon]|nr:hypothetical protein [Candidatus Helarchaeota archaeon]